jgi:hypothetical protein
LFACVFVAFLFCKGVSLVQKETKREKKEKKQA